MNASDVSAVIVTRGDVNLNPIFESLPFDDVVIWDNGLRRDDLAVYGRYAGIAEAKHGVIYVQDDDCVLAPESFEMLLDAYEAGSVVCNMPARFRHAFYVDHALVGFGALFDRDLADRAFDTAPCSEIGLERFHRTCDVVFTALTQRILVDAPYRNLPWAEGADRMYRQPGHVGERDWVLEFILDIKSVLGGVVEIER